MSLIRIGFSLLGMGAIALSQPAGYSDWSVPVNLGATVNSSSIDIAPAVSRNELSLYFTSTRPGGLGGFDIWVCQRGSRIDPWGPAMNLGPSINTVSNDQGAALSTDGHLLFFVSDRAGGYGGQDIWVSWRAHTYDDFGWAPPVNLGTGVNTDANDHGPGYFESEDDGVPLLYFGSNRTGGPGSDDIYVSALTRRGTFGPATLVAELSTPFADVGPDVRRDGLEIYLHSDRPGTLGLFDLWVSTRKTVHDKWSTPARLDVMSEGHKEERRDPLPQWSDPTNLSAPINSPFTEGQPAISANRKSLYFFSNRPGGLGGADLWVTTRTRRGDERRHDKVDGRQ
jgi:hypothetical protein